MRTAPSLIEAHIKILIMILGGILVLFVELHKHELEQQCRAAGGTPQAEYRADPSCWSADGRRMFP